MSLYRSLIRNPLRELLVPPAAQLPALDFLRSCAILMVLCCHVAEEYSSAGGAYNWFQSLPFVSGGWLGVDLFFVLSGFLIGKQLWRELQKTDSVRVGQFLLRRGLRIWPLYFAMLGGLLLYRSYQGLPVAGWWVDAFCISNYLPGGYLSGGWSLSTEEQFYILVPLSILLGAHWRKTLPWYRGPLLACLILSPLLRWLTYAGPADFLAWFATPFARVYCPIHTHADGLIMGLLLANVAVHEGGLLRAKRASLAALLGGGCLFVFSYVVGRSIFLFSGAAGLFGAAAWFLLARPQFSARWLGFRPFHVVSRLSYGMYLNHLLLLGLAIRLGLWLPLGHLPGLQCALMAVLLTILSVAVSCLSYCLIEAPFLRLRERVLQAPTHQPVGACQSA